MAKTVILPQLGETMEAGTIVEWLKKEGDPVEEGDILFQFESDKAVLEVESRYKGTLLKILVEPEIQVPVLTPVAIIGEPGEDITGLLEELGVETRPKVPERPALKEEPFPQPERPAAEAIPSEGRILASPRARRLAREKGVDLGKIQGTGPHGRIIERDVLAYLEARPKATPLAERLAAREGVPLEEIPTSGPRIRAEDVLSVAQRPVEAAPPPAAEIPAEAEIKPLRGLRAIIAERMATSAHTTAAITLHTEVDATALVTLREQLRDALAQELGFNLGYNDLLGVIVARCLVEFPYMNVQLTEQGIRQMPEVNIGIAVDTERGLLVPVVRHADKLTLRQFARTAHDLIERARQGKALPDELRGGTFTITNLGMFGVDAFTPIINLPECAILGIGRIRPVPAVVDGQITIRQKMWLSLTVDHRLVDGAPAARFLQGIVRYIESPYLLLA